MKNITICFLEITSPIDLAIKAVLGLIAETVDFVDDPWTADLVIAEKVIDLIPFYTEDGYYMLIDHLHRSKKRQPKNVNVISCTGSDFMPFLMKTVTREFSSRAAAPATLNINFRVENDGAMQVLVIDDTPLHQKSAEILLGEYDLTIACGYDEAMELLKNNSYDVVLTDMEMPASKQVNDQVLGELIPYGLLLYSEAARCGVRHVAVVTNLNHHTDPISNAFDTFCAHPIRVENAIVKFMHAPMTNIDGQWAKDWKSALQNLLK